MLDARSWKMTTLDDDVLTVYERACQEKDWAVAEHLLRALETLARREGADDRVESAYLELVRTLNGRPCH